MSKNLAEEYQNLANSDRPDLWERIEKGIAEKITPVTDADNGRGEPRPYINPTKAVETPVGDGLARPAVAEKKPPRNADIRTISGKDFEIANLQTIKLGEASHLNRRRFFRRYSGLVAACLCAAIIIPVIYFGNGIIGERSSGGNSASYDNAPVPAPELAGSSTDSSKTAEVTMTNAENDELADSGAGSALTEDQVFAVTDGGAWDGDNAEDRGMAGETANNSPQAQQNSDLSTSLAKVSLEITGFASDGETYEARVITIFLANEYLCADDTIQIKKDEGLEVEFAIGETYEVEMVFDEEQGCYIVTEVE
jgi:hypothetical protein